MKHIFFIFILYFFVSCSKENEKENNFAIARVKNSYLYLNDIKDLVPSGTSKKDSLIIVKDFIDRWASQKLLFNASELYLSADKQDELAKLVEQYKYDIYTKAYIEQLVFKSLDTVIDEQEIKKYYEQNKEKFKTNEELVKLRFIQINKNNPKVNVLSSKFVSFSSQNKKTLESNAFELKSYAFNDSIWVDMSQVYEKLPFINLDNKSNYLQIGKTYQHKDSTYLYIWKTSNLVSKNQISPYQYIKPTISKIILNNRKINLINKYQKEITTDALKDNKYEIYNKK